MAKEHDRPIIGWREWVALPALHVPHIKAKIDTGARTSALHAYDIQVERRDGQEYVRFKVHPIQKSRKPVVECEAPLVEHRWIKSSGGHETMRPVILTEVIAVGQRYAIELTLIKRDAMGFRMLLGREAVRQRFLVNPGRSYYGPRPDRAAVARPRKKKKKPTQPSPDNRPPEPDPGAAHPDTES